MLQTIFLQETQKFYPTPNLRGSKRPRQNFMNTNVEHKLIHARDPQLCKMSIQTGDFTLKYYNGDRTENLFQCK